MREPVGAGCLGVALFADRAWSKLVVDFAGFAA